MKLFFIGVAIISLVTIGWGGGGGGVVKEIL